MNKKIELFLSEVCSFIKCKSVHNDVKEELSLHIGDLSSSYQGQGLDENQAVEKAISCMGNASEIGRDLNKQHKPQTEWTLIILTSIITLFGIAIMFVSSKFDEAQSIVFEKYIFYVIFGIAVMVGTYFLDFTKLKRHAKLLYFLGILLLVFTFIFGKQFQGARRFLAIGPVMMSTNVFSSVLFIISFCGFMDKFRGEGIWGIIKLYGIGFISLLFIVQSSISTALLLLITYAVIILSGIIKRHFGGNRKGQLLCVVSSGVVLILSATFFTPLKYRLNLFLTGGKSDPFGSGWIYTMAGKILEASNLWGTANPLPEGSIEHIMPNLTSDFAFLNIVSHFGWITGIVLTAFIAVLIVRMFFAARKINNSFGFYLLLSACTMLSVQFVISILINLGLFPIMGVSIPLISYGASGYVASMFLMGLVLSVWRRNNLIVQSVQKPQTKSKRIEFSDNKLIIDFNSK